MASPVPGPRSGSGGYSLEDFITEAHDLGWHLYSLSEASSPRADRWTCRLRYDCAYGNHLIAYGQGPDAISAFSSALDNIPAASPEAPVVASVEPKRSLMESINALTQVQKTFSPRRF